MSSRRTFLQQGALTAAGIWLSPALLAQPISTKKTKVIIIGAGLAGLAAAHKLKQKGIDFTILESQNRFGGRVFSFPIDHGLVIELGGEWVGESHTRMRELCGEFQLELQNNQMDSHLIYKDEYAAAGKWGYSDDWQRKFKKIIEDYQQFSEDDKRKLDQYDWWHFLVNNGCEGRDLDLRELTDSTDFGESIRHVSAFAALAEYAESSEKNEMDLKIAGGNGMLAKKLAEKIGLQNILLQHKVGRIVQQKDKVQVFCDNGKMFEADKIICTLPTFAIKKIDWQPELPPEKVEAIHALQYARINKHAMLFGKRFWQAESFDLVTDQLPHYFYHATKNQLSEKGVLISYSIGDKAAVVANQSAAWNAGEISRTLEPHFGEIKSLLLRQENFYWGNNDYSQGAYALYGPGQWFGLRPKLAQAFLHTHFAGEHLADWQGFMEGAIQTGESAAELI
ncbi:flavin monoamine oxidase family protein [Flavobacterium sp.]|uniref:flavin monoamine oxidase family protein n=1 Tax=Flavobacterium sp. TaxID=239 RepID=UPI0039E52404